MKENAKEKGRAEQENPAAFKHHFGPALLKRMGAALKEVYEDFDSRTFQGLANQLAPLEMKARVRLIRETLRALLPPQYPKALKIILASTEAGVEGFDLWPYSDFVQTYGLDEVKLSLKALKQLTPLFTSEFAVRPYLKEHQAETLAFLADCAKSKNEHWRRWASEGSRPRLPWGERLHTFIKQPELTRPILDLLKFDEALYVRKSVANHLNDIAKDHPAYVIVLLKAWGKAAQSQDDRKKIDWITRHSLRTLIKSGHPEALALIGVDTKAAVEITDVKLNKKRFQVGDDLLATFTLRSLAGKPQKVVVDYIVHHVKAKGDLSPKVFKLKTLTLGAREELRLTKTHSLKAVTTRVYYPGEHQFELQINGRSVYRTPFTLSL